jgi:hypothetical protein
VTIDLRAELTAAYADVSLSDPVDQVVRRGRRIRRARRARQAAPALAAVAAVVVGVVVTGGDGRSVPAGPVELVAFSAPAFPLSFDRLPDGLTGPSLSLDPSFKRVGPGAAHAGWSDPDDPASGVGISVADDEPENMGEELAEARIGEEEGTVYEQRDGAAPFVTVVWERADDQWVTVGGEGRFASEQAVVDLARQVVDRGIPVPLRVTLAPRGWVLVGYKEDRIVTVADPAGPPATEAASRTLTVYLPQPPSDPADLSQEVTGGQAVAVELAVHGRPAYLLPTSEGDWFLQASMADGTVFVLQTPGDLTREQVVQVAEGVARG